MADVRRVREQMLVEFDHDIRAYAAHIIAIQEEKKKQGFEYASPPAQRPEWYTQGPASPR